MFLKQTLAAALLAATTSIAAPLDRGLVAADAKWVLHLDMDAFRDTRIGKFLVDDLIEVKLASVREATQLNFDTSFTKIQGLTAYGPGFGKEGEGALLVRTTANMTKDLEALAGLTAVDDEEGNEITRLQENPYAIYKFKEDFFVAPDVNGTAIFAKTEDQIEKARAVLIGKTESLAFNAFNYPRAENAFFFLGVAEGFNEASEVPPQAQVLKETEGGRLVIGESGENLFVNLILRGKSAEAATRVQQMLQGIVAFLSLSQDPEVTQFAEATKIANDGENVTVNIQFPVENAIEKIKEGGVTVNVTAGKKGEKENAAAGE